MSKANRAVYKPAPIHKRLFCAIWGHNKVKGRIYYKNTYSVSKCKVCGVGIGKHRVFVKYIDPINDNKIL